ncbi:MAG TPA: sodium:pantothenate symporter [Porticoccaceae bacterium]|nr:sodium:pantothenate symporter [Porticoccaceae bacterium]
MDSLRIWAWAFLILYVGAMIGFGYLGMRHVKSSDDFSTARGEYGMWFLAFAMTATTASGATFLGIPGLGYRFGLPALGYALVYPFAVYLGVWLCFRQVQKAGNSFNNRSIPEFMGDRYQSEGFRVIVSVFSVVLLFYLAAQLLAGLVMFEQMLGLNAFWALAVTTLVLLVYVVLGGAHADIITDGAQGATMLALAVMIVVLFVLGVGVDGDGGLQGVLNRLWELDPKTVQVHYEGSGILDSYWDFSAIFLAHLSLGMLPHIGNKVWALKEGVGRTRFLGLCLLMGVVLASMIFGGILARAVLGDTLLEQAGGPNQAIPALFIELFPVWLAALLGVAILSAIMSTADGLVISTSQVFANDIYRRTLARKLHPRASEAEIDHNVLRISRVSIVFVLAGAAVLAWYSIGQNIALMVWVGLGGMMAALAGPLIIGVFWRGVTRQGAIWGFVAGAVSFTVLRNAWLPGGAVDGGLVDQAWFWLASQANNPFACTTVGEGLSIAVTVLVSLLTKPLPKAHVDMIFGADTA